MRVSRILKSIFENVNRSERMRKGSCSAETYLTKHLSIGFEINERKRNQPERIETLNKYCV